MAVKIRGWPVGAPKEAVLPGGGADERCPATAASSKISASTTQAEPAAGQPQGRADHRVLRRAAQQPDGPYPAARQRDLGQVPAGLMRLRRLRAEPSHDPSAARRTDGGGGDRRDFMVCAATSSCGPLPTAAPALPHLRELYLRAPSGGLHAANRVVQSKPTNNICCPPGRSGKPGGRPAPGRPDCVGALQDLPALPPDKHYWHELDGHCCGRRPPRPARSGGRPCLPLVPRILTVRARTVKS